MPEQERQVRAISLWQPWASAIARGHKSIETRGKHWGYRGPILIHAAKNESCADNVAYLKKLGALPMDFPAWADLPLGAIVAVAFMYDCRRTELLVPQISDKERELGDYSRGRFGLLLRDVKPLSEPIPFKGAQGLFNVPYKILPAGLIQ